jgi:hypothetical protein
MERGEGGGAHQSKITGGGSEGGAASAPRR